MFQSCGNEESANSKKNQTPKTACECIDYYAKEVKKIADMTDEQFAKSENEIEKIAAKMDAEVKSVIKSDFYVCNFINDFVTVL